MVIADASIVTDTLIHMLAVDPHLQISAALLRFLFHPFLNFSLTHTVVAFLNCNPSINVNVFFHSLTTELGSQMVVFWCVLSLMQVYQTGRNVTVTQKTKKRLGVDDGRLILLGVANIALQVH